MSSKARDAFQTNCEDIERLLSIHANLAGAGPGRKWKLEALHKASIVLLTADWEAFCEDLAAEGLERLVADAPSAEALPKRLKQTVAEELKGAQHQLAVWRLSGDGWRDELRSRLDQLQEDRNRTLNTPKTAQINELFENALGICNVASAWRWKGMTATTARAKLDKYVSLRGDIAHRGSAASSVGKSAVTDFYDHVKRLVACTEHHVVDEITTATQVPWP